MKKIKLLFLILVGIQFTSCDYLKPLPKNLLENKEGYDRLVNYIYSHHKTVDVDNIELMEFEYYASLNIAKKEEFNSTNLVMTLVVGEKKDRVVEYSVSSIGALNNSNVEVSIGENHFDSKVVKDYEAFKPFLFSSKILDFDIMKKVIKESEELFQKEYNPDTYYCHRLTIEIEEPGQDPMMKVLVEERETIPKKGHTYVWNMKGEKVE